MTVFAILAALLVVAVSARLLLPLLRAPRPASRVADERREANLAIFRDQLLELQRERDEDLLSEGDFEQARRELQRRLLEEVKSTDTDPPEKMVAARSKMTAAALFIALPLTAAGFYALLGNPQALDPMATQAPSRVSQDQMEAMLAKLVNKLRQNPDDVKGWVMLARSYKVLGRYAEAAEAYTHASAAVDKEAGLLADYAEVLAQINDGKLSGKPEELLTRALKLDPDEPQALLLAGAAASERRDFAAAVTHWSRLLLQLDAGSEEARAVEDAVTKARDLAGKIPAGNKASKPAAARQAISGEITLSPQLTAQIKQDDVLFIFARSEDGQRMPLAVLRGTAADLPMKFRLDDSLALPGGRKISDFATVTIEARIAKAGKAQTSSGDLFGRLTGVKQGKEGLRLRIDQVQP